MNAASLIRDGLMLSSNLAQISMKRTIKVALAFLIVSIPILLMLYGMPLSFKSHSTLKCYDTGLKQRPC
jgi:hypothetical protein